MFVVSCAAVFNEAELLSHGEHPNTSTYIFALCCVSSFANSFVNYCTVFTVAAAVTPSSKAAADTVAMTGDSEQQPATTTTMTEVAVAVAATTTTTTAATVANARSSEYGKVRLIVWTFRRRMYKIDNHDDDNDDDDNNDDRLTLCTNPTMRAISDHRCR
jgi:hypothetical protein